MSAADRPARRKLTASNEEVRVGGEPTEPAPPKAQEEPEPTKSKTKQGAAASPPNGGGQVPGEEGTQVGTSPGTQVVRTEEGEQERAVSETLDFSARSALRAHKDPDQDWVKSGWQGLRYVKATVDLAVKFKWRGYTERQDVVNAALQDYLPKELLDLARDMASRGEL